MMRGRVGDENVCVRWSCAIGLEGRGDGHGYAYAMEFENSVWELRGVGISELKSIASFGVGLFPNPCFLAHLQLSIEATSSHHLSSPPPPSQPPPHALTKTLTVNPQQQLPSVQQYRLSQFPKPFFSPGSTR